MPSRSDSARADASSWKFPLLLGLVVLFHGVVVCPAQTCKPPDRTQSLSTDRPSVTNASTTVPCRTLLFENGFNETAASGQRTWDLPQTLLRFGATTTTELRFTVPDYYWHLPTGSASATGLSDLAVGLKQQLGPTHGFDVSAMATLSLPTGAAAPSSHGYDLTLQLPWSRKLSTNWTSAGMFTVAWPTQNGNHNTTGQVTALFDRQLTKTCDTFAEYAGTFPGSGGPQHLVDFGAIYKPTNNQQLDVRGGLGLSAATLDHFVGAGYSFRFDFYRGR